jgi:hypothetical protein
MSDDARQSTEVLQRLSFRSARSGPVKRLDAFDKSRHTVPDAVNAATNGFLAKLVADELATEAESIFQAVRGAFGYKRKEMSLSVGSPVAELTTPDFVFELAYALNEADPAEWTLTRTLHPKTGGEFLHRPECAELFAGQFTDLVFGFAQAVRVEAVIDAIEELEDSTGLKVDYPSDCRDCELSVEGVAATVRLTASTLEMVFPQPGAPGELLDAFLAVRHRFRVAEDAVLAGLIH